MEWLKHGWETQWMQSRTWSANVTGEELQRRLQSMELIAKKACESNAMIHLQPALSSYLQELSLSLFTAAKWEAEHKTTEKAMSVYYNLLYSADLSKYLEAYLHHPASADLRPELHELNELVLHSVAILVDQTKLVLRSLAETSNPDPRRVTHAISMLRTLCAAIDKKTMFHKDKGNVDLPQWLPCVPLRKFTHSNCDAACSNRAEQKDTCTRDVNSAVEMPTGAFQFPCLSTPSIKISKSSTTDKPSSHLWIKILLEYFGSGSSLPGFQLLVSLLYCTTSQKLPLEVSEIILRFISIAMEYLKDDKRHMFLAASLDLLKHIYTCYVGQRLDKISIGSVAMISRHLNVIFGYLLPAEVVQELDNDMQKRMRDQVFQFLQLSGNSKQQY
ncbi:hypothetical protein Mapa_000588 [Marchantia paleacea]|nr:hypothetical protein Mapa_000588 [Marchantia paleacea]